MKAHKPVRADSSGCNAGVIYTDLHVLVGLLSIFVFPLVWTRNFCQSRVLDEFANIVRVHVSSCSISSVFPRWQVVSLVVKWCGGRVNTGNPTFGLSSTCHLCTGCHDQLTKSVGCMLNEGLPSSVNLLSSVSAATYVPIASLNYADDYAKRVMLTSFIKRDQD
jgi:hypothetical protein